MPILILAALLAFPLALSAQDAADPALVTVERIWGSRDFAGAGLGPTEWTPAGDAYTRVEESEDVEGGVDIVRYDAASGERTVLVPAGELVPAEGSEPLGVRDYDWSADQSRLLIFTNTARVWRANTRGDYWVLDRRTGSLRRLGGDAPESTLMFAKFSPDGRRVGYVRYDQNDLYVEEVESGRTTRLTDDGSRTIINGTFDWVYEEEFGNRDGWRWSPDGQRVAFWQLDAEGVRDFLLINYTDSLYSYVTPIQYPKAGETNSAARVGVVAADGGEPVWMDVPGDPRNNYIARMDWAASSDEIVMQHLDRLQQTLTIYLGDAASGAVRSIYGETDDDGWINVRAAVNVLHWLDEGRSFLWASEHDGWRRLWRIARDGGDPRALTPAGEDVISVQRITDAHVYYIASPENATRRALYRVPLEGGAPERLTPPGAPGWNGYDVSPNGGWALHSGSSFGAPGETRLVRLPEHATQRTLVDNASQKAAVSALDRGEVEFFTVDADGVELDGWIMKPTDFDPAREYPMLLYVYGEPAGQRVTDSWGGSNYLWHLMLTQRGYLVASIDPRGTPAPKGSEWRKAIYRKIGTLTSRDIAAGTRAITAWPYVDEDRVGIWGWSGGGSQTLNALFRYPDVFDVGISVAPVPDVRLYDTIYQERYMGLPQDNPEDYEESSPLTWAGQLEGDLLLVHGTGDDNVHYQGTERLINALIGANKPFDVMVYPNRTHGIFEGRNTRLHLYSLMTRFLTEHLRPGPGEAVPATE
ncbi:MAG: S9 family peptidase [Gemmatimonadota bacterium]